MVSKLVEFNMLTKIFNSGNSQAIRIPKEMQLNVKEVEINKVGNSIIITELPESWDKLFQSLNGFSKDFFENGREELKLETREAF